MSGTAARVEAQAKLNLFLRVLAREASGYHQIETLFCRLELSDSVTVRTGGRGRTLACTGDVIPPNGLGPAEENLAWRAAVAYSDATGWPGAFAVEIEKRIPVGGGLGGGSADAGGVLRALNTIAPRALSERALLDVAAALGADVPFLTLDEPLALGWGRGERLVALPALPRRQVRLLTFDFGVSTRDAYAMVDEAREGAHAASQARVLRASDVATWPAVARLAENDFEPVVAPRYPAISESLDMVRRAHGLRTAQEDAIVLMSGSGATVFVIAGDGGSGQQPEFAALERTVATHTATSVVGVEVIE